MDDKSKRIDPNASMVRRLSVLQRNELLELAEEVASLGHWMLDLDSGTLFWSDEVYRIHDVRREDYVPDVNTAIDFYHPEDAARVSGLLDSAISDRQPFDFEFRLVRADGETRLVHSRARVRVDEDDRVVAVFGTFHDITARKRSETLRRELLDLSTLESRSPEEKIARLLALGRRLLKVKTAFIEAERDGERRLAFVEDGTDRLTVGQTLRGAPLPAADEHGPASVLPLEEYLGRVCAWLGPDGEEHPYRQGLGLRLRVEGRAYGSVWFVGDDTAATAIKDASSDVLAELGQFVSYELGACQRMNDLVGETRALEEKQRELDLVLNNVPSRIWYKDGNNGILFLNEQAAESMGMSREEAQGANTADLFPEMADQYLEDDRAVIESGKPRLGIVERYTPLGGEHGWVSTDKIPFKDSETGEPRVLAVATDITRLMEARLSLERQAARLRRSNHDLDQFAHVAAHDLRTPLRGMEHIVNWIEEDLAEIIPDGVSENLTDHLRLLRGRVGRMDRMLTDMLTFARASYEEGDEPTEPAGLNALLSEAREWVGDAGGIEISVAPAEFDLMVAPTKVQQMLTNLMTNAVRHHDRDTGRVAVSTRRNDSGASIIVTDDGPGIEPEYHDTVFDAFATLARRDEVDSTGIGLAVVQRIMHSIGGQVMLISPEGERGCAFELAFPARLVNSL